MRRATNTVRAPTLSPMLSPSARPLMVLRPDSFETNVREILFNVNADDLHNPYDLMIKLNYIKRKVKRNFYRYFIGLNNTL